nr:uncharacterized mitochondrial protein AtMg00810-like [Tanacetum cinerariifolium]
MRPFGCPVTIFNTIDHLDKFDGKADEGFFVGYSLNSKAFRVFNSKTRIMEEDLHIRFSESTPNIVGSELDWLFDIDALTRTINYEPIVASTQSNDYAGTKTCDNAGQARKETEPVKDYILLQLWTANPPFSQDPKSSHDDGSNPSSDDGKKVDEDPIKENEYNELLFDPNMPALEDVIIFNFSNDEEDDGPLADMNDLDTTIQMSSMGQLTFLLGLQGKQKKDGIFITQDKYVAKILKKFRFTEIKTASAPMKTQKPLLNDEDGEEVDVHMYRSMIGSLMYLTSSKPDIMFAVCACARYQVNPKVSHFHVGKRIFRYLKGHPKLGLWYPRDSLFDLVAYTDSDYAGRSLDRKSTIGGCQFFGCKLISWQCKKQTVVANSTTEAEYVTASSCCGQSTAMAKTINWKVHIHARVDGNEIVITESSVRRDLQLVDEEGSTMPTDPHHTPTILQPSSSQPQKTQKPRKPKRKDTQVPQPSGPTKFVADEAVHKELGDSLVRAATSASSLDAEQDSGGGPRCQKTMGDTTAQTRFESVSKRFNDSLLARGNTLQSDEDRHELNELMAFCTNLQTRVLDLGKTKTTQCNEIASLKKEESSGDKESLGEDASKQGRRIDVIDQNEDITLINVQNNAEMFDVNDLCGEELFVAEQEVVKDVNENIVEEVVNAAQDSTATTTITTKEITLAQTLEALKTSKPKVKGIFIQEQEETGKSTTITATIPKQQSQDKGKWKMIEEHVKPKKKDQIRLDEVAAKRLQAQEQEELSNAKKATLFQQLLKKKRKHFEAKRAEEKMNKPPTQAQQRKIMCNYLKNMEEDLIDLYNLVKAKFKSTRIVEDLDLLLWGDLKTMFERHVEDKVWKLKQGYKVLNWKLYESCGIHSLRMQSMHVYMLVEKTYPLTPPTLSMMLEKKLQIDYQSEMAYQLLKLIKKQLKKYRNVWNPGVDEAFK